jgi:hypothetical protein
MGGRQVRTDPAYGHIYDHFAIQYEYEGGRTVTSMCRQIDGCDNRVEEVTHGSEGKCITSSGRAMIEGKANWKFEGENPNPYMVEHKDLVDAIRNGPYLNEGQRIAESTLTAIMGRMSAYSGKSITWDQALNSSLDLLPPPEQLALGNIPTPTVAMPERRPCRHQSRKGGWADAAPRVSSRFGRRGGRVSQRGARDPARCVRQASCRSAQGPP